MSVKFDFSGKVVLITGSNTGIGAATAILFAKFGAQVVITGRNVHKIQAVAKQASEMSPNRLIALEVVADITQEEDIDRLVETTIDTFGKLDILVNNSAEISKCAITDPAYFEKYRSVINTNLNSVVFLTHKCVQHLVKTKGNIINISGISGTISIDQFSNSSVSKSGLDQFTRSIAQELLPMGIRVNSISPGFIRTKQSSEMLIYYEKLGKELPVGRCGEAIDVANAILYMASDHAAFITGTTLHVDGGHIAANIKV